MLAYVLTYGSVPEGEFVDHECHNPDVSCAGGKACLHRRCCNPRHLVAKSNAANMDAANEARQRGKFVTHCPAGHEYDEKNTGWVHRKRKGKEPFWERFCRKCLRIRAWHRKYGPNVPHPEE